MTTPRPPHVALSDADRRRLEEVESLAREGRTDALIGRLDDPSWAVRRAVIAVLARAGNAAIRPLCEVLLHARNDEARLAAAVDALCAASGEVDGEVIRLLYDAHPPIVCDAAQILGRRKAVAAVAALTRLVDHADDNVAVAAIEALGRIGGATVIEPLVAAARSKNFFRTFPAIDVLGRSGDPRAIEPLTALVDDPHYAFEAVRALGRTGDIAALPTLAATIARANDAMVRVAASAMVEIWDRHRQRPGSEPRTDAAVIDALASVAGTGRRLVQALVGADATERTALVRLLGFAGGDEAAARLVELLDGEPNVARAAADALVQLGREGEASLLRALGAASSAQRLILLPAVRRRPGATAPLVECLDDPDAEVRALACDALARAGDGSVVGAVFRHLSDEDPRVAQAAVSAVQSLGSAEAKALAVAGARSKDVNVRRASLRILAYFGDPSAYDVLAEAMNDPDEKIRDVALGGLPYFDDARAKVALLAAARHASSRTRATAVRALGQTEGDDDVLAALRAALTDDDAWVRYYACQSLGTLRDEKSTEPLAARMTDGAGQVRVAAVEALSRLRSPLAAAALRRASASTDRDVQRAALLGLGATKNAEALPIMFLLAESDDPGTRLVALSAMSEIDSPEVVAALASATSDQDNNVRNAAIGFLAARPGPEATRALAAMLPRASLRERVASALATAVPGRIEGVLGALEEAQGDVASILVGALARMGRADASAAIPEVLGFANVHARRAAASALATTPSTDARAILERAVREDEDLEVRRLCGIALDRV